MARTPADIGGLDRGVQSVRMTSVPGERHSAPAVVESKPHPGVIRTFDDAQRYLYSRVNFERSRPRNIDPSAFKLDRTIALLAALGDPHTNFRSVHVAGSKGKGSVCEMVASALGACGYAVGVYTSPHLVDITERVRVGNQPIARAAFVSMVERCRIAAETLPARMGECTFFELMTALAFEYFAHQAVDVAVVEVGLGGRLDCTNVITPEVCGLTSIQLEHTDILGATLAEIAGEKAGIMKAGVPAVTVPQELEVMEVFRRKAEEVGAPLFVLGEDVEYSCRFEAGHDLGPHARICVDSPRSLYEHIAVPFRGEHQAANCGLALALLDQLAARGFVAPEGEVARGLANTPTHGRMELAWSKPRILLDTAHTPESVRALIKAAGAHLRFDSLVAIFGCSSDKNADAMLAEIARGADKVIFTRVSGNPRAMSPEELACRFEETGAMCQVAPTLKEAINIAARAVQRDDLILITGSCYLVGEAKRLLAEHAARKQGGA
ncbi:MAG: bifunctional folylpolyglutamate synthase/dihydrofolate synthase [Leptolyngbya sp. PLA3]|nr:MAG: bifunctional folylpolyglutamate synthase/dihydrofolate synthase [Cyanobacteria bacterium CYA]MCE7967428.1 bifunctional folylpolyglutamate synthase/dihydrofolate synthase [Leptolyngbya sp. PL-A3]